jgi:hypothetical protein
MSTPAGCHGLQHCDHWNPIQTYRHGLNAVVVTWIDVASKHRLIFATSWVHWDGRTAR